MNVFAALHMPAPGTLRRIAATQQFGSYRRHSGHAANSSDASICCGAQNFDAIGGTTDIDWPPAPIASEAYDPQPTYAGLKSRSAARPGVVLSPPLA